MCNRWLIPTLALAGALLPTAGLAQSTDGPRQPDRVLRPCALTEKCVVRSVGDFNGDGIDDLLFEVVNQNSRAIRRFELILGPYDARGADLADTPLKPTTTFPLPLSRKISVLPAQDINSDGVDDLIFFAATRSQNYEWQRVAVLYGRADWPEIFDLGSASRGDVVFSRQRDFEPWEDRNATPRLSVAIADINGDGLPDVLFGSDPVPANDPEGKAAARLVGGSDIAVMFGRAGPVGRKGFATDVRIADLGACSAGLAGAGDITGDGIADVVARRCVGDGLPDRLLVLPGQTTWPAELSATGALAAARSPASAGSSGLLDNLNAPDFRGRLGNRNGLVDHDTVDAEVPPPALPRPGRGYLPESGNSSRTPDDFTPGPGFFIADLNGDGVDDILFEFGDKAHVFNGGPDVRARVAAGYSDRIVLNASFGATMLAQSWRRADLDGDARPDLVLAQQPVDSAPTSRSDPREAKQPTETTGTPGTPILMFRGGDGYETEEVLDAEDRPASATWRDPASHLWGVGDFNGDGITDVLLGSDPTDLTESRFPVVFGPFTSGGAAKAP